MNSFIRLVTVVAGFVLLLNITPSWGQTPTCHSPGCNPTASDANGNTAGGTGALSNVDETATGGVNNTAFGFDALVSTTTGDNNTATGFNALINNTTGASNTASGRNALFSNTTGFDNTATGVIALAKNTTGSLNTASGFQALAKSTTGNNNTATGANALAGNDTGNLNTATGFQALEDNFAGNNNTAIGAKALKKSITGTKNIAIGFQAGVTLQTGNNNIYIGNQGAGDESQTIRIGTAQTQTFMAGINTTKMGTGELVAIDPATGQLGIANTSSARYKQDIAPMGLRSEGLLQLRPVTFAYKDDAQATMHYGLVAEEVAAVYPQLVTYAPTGEVRTVRYQELIPMLLNELQRQRQEFQQTLQSQAQALHSQQQALQRQEQELAELRALMGQGRETASLSR